MSIKFIAIAAITLDGKIARHKSHMSNWTSQEDKVFMRALLDKCDCIIVGNNTYKTAIKPLSKRNCIVLTRAAPLLPLGEGARLARRSFSEGRRADEGSSGKLLYCNPKKVGIKKIIRDHNYKTIAILGGAQTYTFCLENNMLDELYLTIEPVVFGEGINLFADDVVLDKKFKLVSVKKLNKQGSILLKYIKD